jgi:hypothetical protein
LRLPGEFIRDPVAPVVTAETFSKRDMATAVSHGAVFRALNKDDGPTRKIQSNFGFLQIEQYSKTLPAHQAAVPTYNDTDGKRYIYDVLDWVIKKVLDVALFLFFRTFIFLSLHDFSQG